MTVSLAPVDELDPRKVVQVPLLTVSLPGVGGLPTSTQLQLRGQPGCLLMGVGVTVGVAASVVGTAKAYRRPGTVVGPP